MNKIAIILEDMRLGGPQKQLIYFLQESIKTKTSNKYLLIVPKNSKKKLSKFLDLNKIQIKELNIQYLSAYSIVNYIKFFFKDFFQLKNCLKKIKKVYIAGGTSNLKSLLISIFLKKNIYFHIHDIKSNFIIKSVLFILSKFIKKIFFASKCSEKYYYFLSKKPEKIILRSSINPDYFKRKKRKKNFFNIGIVANINPDKNIELLIKIIENINDKNIKFKLIGNLFVSQKKYFKENLSTINKIIHKLKWHKNIDHPKEIMKSFDILLCTSNYESLPLSIIEALSMSIPVISTDVGDISYVLNKKKCGFIVDPKVDEFTNVIHLLKNDRNKMLKLSNNAKKNVYKNFNIKNYKKKLEKEIFID